VKEYPDHIALVSENSLMRLAGRVGLRSADRSAASEATSGSGRFAASEGGLARHRLGTLTGR